jgi:hypothetical protein
MKLLGMLAGVALVVGIGSAAVACEDELYASNEPIVVADCTNGNCATEEQQATAPPQAAPAAAPNVFRLSDDPTKTAPPPHRTGPCGKLSVCATEEPTKTAPPAATAPCGSTNC